MRNSPSISAGSDGFTAIPRHMFDLLLCLPLNKRDLSILLLVVRLTYGCRGNRWARLRQADLSAIGIGPNHARECLCSLLDRKLLLRHGSADAYRLNDTMLLASITPDGAAR